MEKLEDGSHFGKWKVKVYKHPGSSFILCQDKYDWEFIFSIREDGLLSDGIYRFRHGGYTDIGSWYFKRSGRGEERNYYLVRNNESENIKYLTGSSFQKYDFNSETLVWTKKQ